MKKQHVHLTKTERAYLEELSSHKTVAVRVLKRALALLALDQGATLEAVARHQQLTNDTIAQLRNRYQAQGLTCLYDTPRSGRPPKLTGTQRAQITALACSAPPPGYSQWSLRLLADRSVELEYCETISYTQVRQILKKMPSSRT